MLDDVDRRLLRYLQSDPDEALGALAERAGTTLAVASRRLSRMRETGIIRAQEAVIDWAALGYGVEVSLRIALGKTETNAFDQFEAEARNVPEVIELQTFLGRVDVRLSIIARDMQHYQRIYRDKILTLPFIADIEALMHVSRIKANEVLPV